MTITPDDLENRSRHHPPTTEMIERAHAVIREECRLFAETLVSLVPAGRELTLALTQIEQAMMWANAGIARNQDRFPG